MAVDLMDTEKVFPNEKEERRANALKTLAAIQAWPYWEEVYLNCVKESSMTPEAFAEAVRWGDSSRAGFEKAMQASQMTREQFNLWLPEYQKFMALCSNYSHIGMMSTGVDRIWHGHMLVSDRYQQASSLAAYYIYPIKKLSDCS